MIPAPDAPPLLAVRGVSHAFGTQAVLDGVSLTLHHGGIAALLGPSGCGKTTLLRLVAGFERLQAGHIALGGTVASAPHVHMPPDKRRVGMVFQDFALFPHLTVARNIAFGLVDAPAQAQRARVDELLALVGLEGFGARYPHELSGGQQQRVALARALANRPPLVLLDEPFSSLDGELRERLAGEVRQVLLHEGAAAVLVTHDQFEAFAFADAIGVMDRGRLAQWDTARNLYESPADRFVANFIGDGALIPGHLADGTVRTVFGAVPIRALPARAGPGSAVEVLLRPDDLVLRPGGPVSGEVVSRGFRGSAVLLRARVAPSTVVPVLTTPDTDCPIGTAVELGLREGPTPRVAFLTR